jgi:polysaccharide biosynthesis/export protein
VNHRYCFPLIIYRLPLLCGFLLLASSLYGSTPAATYILGAGDEISIDIWDHTDLSGSHIIGPDGCITLPLVGSVQLAGHTREAATQAVEEALVPYYLDLIVTLRVDRYTSSRVYVLGRVSNPGVLHCETMPTLLEAITLAGGLPVGNGPDKTALTRCAIFRGREQIVWIDLKRLLKGQLQLNVPLQRDDLVYIPSANDQLVYVLGEVNQPGAYPLSPDMSFMDALALAGGPTADANTKGMQFIALDGEIKEKVSFNKIIDAQITFERPLEENDVIYVPRRGLAKIHYVMSKLSPLSSMLLLGSVLGY